MPLIESQPDALATMYARSLFELALEHGGQSLAESIAGQIEDIIELARQDRTFSEFLASRVLPMKARDKSIDRIFNGHVHPLVLNFLRLLNRKGRLSHLPPIGAALDAVLQAHFGRVEVDVFTAAPIEERQLNLIRDRLAVVLGRQPVLHAYTEASMIGGMKLRIGDQLIDASIASRLRLMQERLTNRGGARIRGLGADLIEGTGHQEG